MDWIDIQAQMPWLGPPPFWLAHPKGPELRSTLAHLGFAVFEARTNATVTEEQFLRLVAQAMGLSEYASDNWDAFVDGFGNLVRSTTEPIAFIWLDPAEAFVRDLKKGRVCTPPCRQYWTSGIVGDQSATRSCCFYRVRRHFSHPVHDGLAAPTHRRWGAARSPSRLICLTLTRRCCPRPPRSRLRR